MAYYTQVVQPGEVVRAVGRLHWLIYARAIGLLIVTLALLAWAGTLDDAQRQHATLISAACAAVLTVLVFLVEWIRRRSTEIVVTDRRVIYKRGFIARHTVEMNISKVETVDVEQNIGGRILDYGTVLIRGTGESLEPLRHIATPLAIRNAITVG
jgi:uncharacterized membrane protein YdbT with pleckstrin-like domain